MKAKFAPTGTKEDEPRARRLVSITRSKPINVTGRTSIMQLAAIIQKCQVFISSDSAPMHLAAYSGVPFVALFGPTDPKRHLEPHSRHRIIYKKLKCSPCYKPKCSHLSCMKKIDVEEIVGAATELLKEE